MHILSDLDYYRYIHTYMGRIASHNYRGQETLQHAICMLNNKESWWYNPKQFKQTANSPGLCLLFYPSLKELDGSHSLYSIRWLLQLKWPPQTHPEGTFDQLHHHPLSTVKLVHTTDWLLQLLPFLPSQPISLPRNGVMMIKGVEVEERREKELNCLSPKFSAESDLVLSSCWWWQLCCPRQCWFILKLKQ